jgi:signal transduction histidine kinase
MQLPATTQARSEWHEGRGTTRARSGRPPRVAEADLCRRRAAHAAIIEVAQPHLEWVHAALGPGEHAIALTDPDGVVLVSLASEAGSALGLAPGTYARSAPPHPWAPVGRDGDWRGAVHLAAPGDRTDHRLLAAHVAWTIERQLTARPAPPAFDAAALSLLHHELRTPLSAIVLRSAMLLRPGAPDPARVQENARGIQAAVRSAERLLRNLHDLLAFESGLLRLHAEPHDLGELADEALELLRPMADDARVLLMRCLPSGLRVRADGERCLRVLSNLLENAIRFTEPGGTVTVAAERRGADVEIEVRDTGAGIAGEALCHVFERGWSGRGSTGLGLWLVRRLVESQGGRVDIRSLPGVGTTVSFTLPLA